VLESSTEKCPVCGGSGHVRSVSSVSLQLLRAIEEMLIKGATHNLIVRTRSEVALYVLNHKRAHLRALEERFRITITISADPTVTGQQSYIIDRGEQVHTVEAAKTLAAAQPEFVSPVEEEEEVLEAEAEAEAEAESEAAPAEAAETPDLAQAEIGAPTPRGEAEREGGRRRRRRGRGRGRGGEPREPREGAPPFTQETGPEHAIAHEDYEAGSPEEVGLSTERPRPSAPAGAEGEVRRRRRRGRRGGRRRHGRNGGEAPFQADTGGGPGPEIQYAGEDFPPVSDEDASAIAPPFDEPVAPPAVTAPVMPPAAAAQPAVQQEPPRRRSTIREPAPIAVEGAPPLPPAPATPPPTPVVSSTAAEETATPKRGWWGKRFLGDKS
jgi:ribonuclease E